MPKVNETGHDYVRLLPRWKGKPDQARFIRRGFKKVWMQHQPGQPGFDAEWHQLMSRTANNDEQMKPERTPLKGHIDECWGSVGQLARDYFASSHLQSKNPRTQHDARVRVENMLKVVVPGELDDRPVAHWAVEKLNRRRMIKLQEFVPDPIKPPRGGKAADKRAYIDNHTWAMRAMFNWAIDIGWQSDPDDEATAVTFNPAAGIKPLRAESDGWHTMTLKEVKQFLAYWRIGTMPYLAMMLLLYTVVRRSDVTTLGQHMLREDGKLHFTEIKGREKTPKKRAIRLRQKVLEAIAATPGATATDAFLSRVDGEKFKPSHFTTWFKERCAEAGLPHCSPHGVRKHVATQAGDKGASDLTIAELLGHTTTKNVGKYVKKVQRAPLYERGMDAVFGADD